MPRNKCILVVDDDSSVRVSMNRLLRAYGFSVLLFESGKELLERGDLDDAVCAILDVNLGDHSGIDLRRRLIAHGGLLPVIFITGSDSPANRSAAIESGCAAYLTKPFAAHALIESIQKARAGIVAGAP
ncbi:Response regulator receiver domain-containing protein [Bradyrhizobium sp. Ghvi]|uniref:response regulator transcription factor n=1 Tax=Bradyrhizobium sp. Ghvi TaxID=1855319 RepID=UPI0008EC4E84|nr:response regulator [Bradyrhizobium sp. Ghvi]SFP21963.1 Response regulator receiver domain-containing protein [Bradyrhizobium sp. Ghvi]